MEWISSSRRTRPGSDATSSKRNVRRQEPPERREARSRLMAPRETLPPSPITRASRATGPVGDGLGIPVVILGVGIYWLLANVFGTFSAV